MNNLFWYICLSSIGVLGAVYTIYKKRDTHKVSTLIIFYLFTTSLAWNGEFIVLGLFNAYAYKTGVFADPWAQNLLGHLIINTTLYPTAAVIMVAYSFRNKWIAFIAALFTFIEYVFVQLGIYKQHWWQYYMTTIAVICFMLFVHKWFNELNKKNNKITRTITFYFVAMVIRHIPAPILLLMGKQYYQIGLINNLVDNLYLASIIIIFIYHFIEALFCVLFTCILKKWYWKVMPFVIATAAQSIFLKMNILIMVDGWKFIYTLFLYEIAIAIYILAERYTLRSD